MSPSTSTTATTPPLTFERLGVRTLINCMGTYTFIGGSRALPQVADAMVEATNHYVQIDELMEKVGQRLAELTGAEWGYVSSGCAAALSEIAAGAMTGGDPEKIAHLPDTEGMKNEIIMQKAERCGYDRAISQTGARIIEIVTLADFEAAVSPRTALVAFTGDQAYRSEIPTARLIAAAHRHGIPCFVDAAAERPDVPNVYLEMGADAVAYSGGKCLRGPQAAGLVLGKRALLWSAFLNAAPHGGIGRPMKAAKEEIMGLLAAVEAWVLGRDHEAEKRVWAGYFDTLRAAIAGIPSVSTQVIEPASVANVSPLLEITWDPALLGWTPATLHAALNDGDPRIVVHRAHEGIRINAYMMEDGDDAIVAQRLADLLRTRPAPAVSEQYGAPADIRGAWRIQLDYLLESATHAMTCEQDGNTVSGTYRSQYGLGELHGTVQGQQVALNAGVGYHTRAANYSLRGTVDGDVMSGTFPIGGYNTGKWRAERVR
ncbi:MAG: aminotransferase class V-fold PLP-dependent enzyme [Chloroflexi bacterium]|nr:aminotransferase class V-fold PLP-dependent enzyme [Chloroflexota bacterium]